MDAGTSQAYALRVLPGAPDDIVRDQFTQETSRLSTLRGRAAIVVPDRLVRLDDGRWAVRRELCTQSLPELVAFSGPLSSADVTALAVVLAEALAAIHRVGVVHGSVTPANVLFRPAGEPVLTDAGLALRRAFPPAEGGSTPDLVQRGVADERSDLYGLGAVLTFAATGHPPSRPGDGSPSGARPDDAPSDDPAGRMPAALAGLVADLLAEEPLHRPPDASAVVSRLRSLPGPPSEAEVLPTRVAGPVGSVPMPRDRPIIEFGPPVSRRRPAWPVLAVAGAVVTVVAVLLAGTLTRRPERAPAPLLPPAAYQAPTPSSSGEVRVDLAEPIDRGTVVDLRWTSSVELDFAVVVTVEGEPLRPILTQRGTRYRVPVDPLLSYCFTVQGFTSRQPVVSSAPRSIRGAVCA